MLRSEIEWNRVILGFFMKWGMEWSYYEEILGVMKEVLDLYCLWVESGSWILGGWIFFCFLVV